MMKPHGELSTHSGSGVIHEMISPVTGDIMERVTLATREEISKQYRQGSFIIS